MVVDRENVQGLILRGYNYPFSRHLLFKFPDAASGRSFLSWVRPQVTHGATWPEGVKPEPLVNLGLTFAGLVTVALGDLLAGVDANLVVTKHNVYPVRNPFPPEFIDSPDPGSLGDLGAEDGPASWWNGRFATEEIHASVHLYTQSEAAMDAAVAGARGAALAAGVVELVPNHDGTPLGGAALTNGRVHFGYVDGVGQPDVDWDAIPSARGKVDLRHFLLGYNSASIPPSASIPSSPRWDDTHDLFRDCCYMGLRWLSQDVPGFERYLDDNAPRIAPNRPAAEAREWLAAKLVGRWRDGTPLALSPEHRDPALAERNDFSYSADVLGTRCPFSAHIRVANPRDQPLGPPADSGDVPRLLRRGSSYGPEWVEGQNDAEERGLIGLFLCASLDRQFLQILRWMNTNDFSRVFDHEVPGRQDPLFGSDAMTRSKTFRIPDPGGDIEVPLPRPFVKSRGTAYLLLPSLSTLDKLIQ